MEQEYEYSLEESNRRAEIWNRRFDNWRDSRIKDGRCPSCEMSVISGVTVHEQGCPDSHLFTTRECKECGTMFTPQSRDQHFCSDSCCNTYYGIVEIEDEEEDDDEWTDHDEEALRTGSIAV